MPGGEGPSSLGFDVGERPSLGIVLLIAPVSGTIRHLTAGRISRGREWVEAGASLLQVLESGTSVDVKASNNGWLGGLLCLSGERVSVGRPLAWIERAEAG